MDPAIRLEVIRCVPLLGAKLTRGACAAKYFDAQEHRSAPPGTETYQRTHRCRVCPVGEAHAAGQRGERWADGSPVEVTSITRAVPEIPREVAKSAEPPREEEHEMPHPPRMITIDDTTRTLAEWCEQLGVTPGTLYKAAQRRGRSLDDEVSARVSARQSAHQPHAEKPARSAPAGEARRAKPRPAREPEPQVVEEVRSTLRSVGPVELLERLGYGIEDLGAHPRGRLVLLTES